MRRRQSKSLNLFEAKRFVQISAAGREAAFYSAASGSRIKDTINPLRSWRLCGEYLTEFMNCHTKAESQEKSDSENNQVVLNEL